VSDPQPTPNLETILVGVRLFLFLLASYVPLAAPNGGGNTCCQSRERLMIEKGLGVERVPLYAYYERPRDFAETDED
jgi:hypothetical protein